MRSREPRNLAIVGGGAAGVAVFIAAVRRHTADRIFMIEPGPVGPGTAFCHSDRELICNTSTAIMSVVPGKPLDFLDYLSAQGYTASAESFVPRRLFGDYLADRFRRYSRLAHRKGIDVTHLPYRFKTLQVIRHRRYRLLFCAPVTAAPLTVSDVVFCTGSGSPRIPQALLAHLKHPHFVSCPYDEKEMHSQVPAASDVLVIGTKLSAIDAALLLCRQGHRVTMLSPSGRLPAVRARFIEAKGALVDADRLLDVLAQWDGRVESPYRGPLQMRYLKYFARELDANTRRRWRTQISLAQRFDERLKEEIAIARNGDAAWEDWVVNFVNTANSVFLNHPERLRGGFHPGFRQVLFEYLAAIALPNAEKLAHYVDRQLLTVEKGVLHRIAGASAGAASWHIDWGKGSRRFDAVVNAAGFNAPRYAINGAGGLEIVTDGSGTGKAIPASPDLSARLPGLTPEDSIWLMGAALQGRLLTSSAIFIIASLAEEIAARMQSLSHSCEASNEDPVEGRHAATAILPSVRSAV